MGTERERAKSRISNAKFGWSSGLMTIEYLEALDREIDEWAKQVDAALQSARRADRFEEHYTDIKPDKKTQSAGDGSDTPPWDSSKEPR